MRKRVVAVTIISTLFISVTACAAKPSFSLIAGIGTTGVFGGVQYRETPYLATMAQIGDLNIDPCFSSGGENYNMGIRLLNGLVAEQWYPWRRGFYLTAGVFINGNRLLLNPSVANTGEYALATPAKVTFHTLDPYFGIGYSQRFSSKSHWFFNATADAAYQGAPKVSVTQGAGPYAQYAYAAEVADLRQSLSGFRWYPVVQAGLQYRW